MLIFLEELLSTLREKKLFQCMDAINNDISYHFAAFDNPEL